MIDERTMVTAVTQMIGDTKESWFLPLVLRHPQVQRMSYRTRTPYSSAAASSFWSLDFIHGAQHADKTGSVTFVEEQLSGESNEATYSKGSGNSGLGQRSGLTFQQTVMMQG